MSVEQSWATTREPSTDPLLILAALALSLLFLGVAAWMQADCRAWAGDDPERVEACSELAR